MVNIESIGVVPHAGTWIEIHQTDCIDHIGCVVPHAGTWIEIGWEKELYEKNNVVPHAGTWIEIVRYLECL